MNLDNVPDKQSLANKAMWFLILLVLVILPTFVFIVLSTYGN